MNPEQPHRPLLSRIVKNWLSLVGVILIIASCFSFFFLLTLDLFGPGKNPYIGILTYLVAPMFFLLGLVLWVAGWLVFRRHVSHPLAGIPLTRFTIDVSRERDRKILLAFVLGGALFLLVSAVGSYQTYDLTKSTTFCGEACHGPMEPQFAAYNHTPHAKVGCTECHIGPGAENFIKAKFNGIHQVYATTFDNFERPIRLSHKIDINQKTCEQCHWPQRFVGNLDRTYSHFLADETNTAFTVRLSLKVGGADPNHGPVGGIHWHMNLANTVEYIATDDLQQTIPWVRHTDSSGKVTVFSHPDFKDDPSTHRIRRMDCMTCHNRPAHHFKSANDAVDLALAAKRIDPSIPWVKSNVVAALIAPYTTKSEGLAKVEQTLRASYAGQAKLEELVSAALLIYRNNFFPEMKADWRAYPNNIGHKDFPGCFRCHDGQHKSSEGGSIKANDCNACHTILAQGNGSELEKISSTGHSFFHIDSINEDPSCTQCHTGAFPKE